MLHIKLMSKELNLHYSNTLTAVRIFCREIPITVFALGTPGSIRECLAVTFTSHQTFFFVRCLITQAFIRCTIWLAITRLANFSIIQLQGWILIEPLQARFTLRSLCIVLTEVAYSSRSLYTLVHSCIVHIFIVVAGFSMAIAVTF